MNPRPADVHSPHAPLAGTPRYAVALVYPPFGPSGLPSLGLALLSAAVKSLGIACRSFYWNLELLEQMPGESLQARLAAYFHLTGRSWTPFNEWIFARLVHDAALDHREAAVRRRLDEACAAAGGGGIDGAQMKRHVLSMRERAAEHVGWIVDQLEPYALVGINTTFYQNLPALALARAIKARWPHKIVVLGGANCDGEMGETLLRRFPYVDHVFSGEADQAFPEFVARTARGEPAGDIRGLLRRDADGAVASGPPAEPLADLNALPLPDFDDYMATRRRVGLDRIQELALALESSRGCWWGARQHCTFCGLNANGMGYRQKDVERFQWEVETIVGRYDARFIFMTDNILSMRYYERFMEWASTANLQTNFFYEIKANVDRTHMARLAAAGVTAVQPGIESFSSKTLSLMRKGTTGIRNVALLKFAREYGVYVAYNILVGFPGEDPSEYDRMTRQLPMLAHLRPPTSMPEVEFHRFSPYHQAPETFGIRLRPSASYRDLYPFPEEELARLAYVFETMDESTRDLTYANELAHRIGQWRHTFREDDCTLTWGRNGQDVLISDRRFAGAPRRYRLKAFAATVFHRMDGPRSLSGLAEGADPEASGAEETRNFLASLFALDAPAPDEIVIQFSREEFARDPEGCVKPLVDAGLFYREADRYLALPVAETYRTMTARWLDVGV